MDTSDIMRTAVGLDWAWAGLRGLRAEIDRMAAGGFDGSDRDARVVEVMARVVAAELDARSRPPEKAG